MVVITILCLPVIPCDYCESAYDVRPMRDPWGDICGWWCARCEDNYDGPGDAYYEDRGAVRHELQYPSGEWRR